MPIRDDSVLFRFELMRAIEGEDQKAYGINRFQKWFYNWAVGTGVVLGIIGAFLLAVGLSIGLLLLTQEADGAIALFSLILFIWNWDIIVQGLFMVLLFPAVLASALVGVASGLLLMPIACVLDDDPDSPLSYNFKLGSAITFSILGALTTTLGVLATAAVVIKGTVVMGLLTLNPPALIAIAVVGLAFGVSMCITGVIMAIETHEHKDERQWFQVGGNVDDWGDGSSRGQQLRVEGALGERQGEDRSLGFVAGIPGGSELGDGVCVERPPAYDGGSAPWFVGEDWNPGGRRDSGDSDSDQFYSPYSSPRSS